jgi:hypothetical protein
MIMANQFNIPADFSATSRYLGKVNASGEVVPVRSASPPIPNMNLLISFCNVWPYGFTLALLNTRTAFFEFIGVNADRANFVGADGIFKLGRGRYAVIDQLGWSGRSGYTIFEKDLSIIDSVDMGENLDLHDLVAYRGGFAFSVSAADQVVLKRPTKPDKIIYTTGNGVDSVHINGLTTRSGRLYCSMFGPKKNGSWREAIEGQIIDCANGDAVASNICQPHTPVATSEGLWVCESGSASILFFDNSGTRHCIAKLRGYLRGLVVTPHYIIAGASAVRRQSRHLGVDIEIKSADSHIETARIYIIDRQTGNLWSFDIPHIGHEIFSVCQYSGPRRPSLASTLASSQQRTLKAAQR